MWLHLACGLLPNVYDEICVMLNFLQCMQIDKIIFPLTYSDIAAVQGSAPFFKKCVEKVRTSKKCPVCTRGFDSESDIDKVVNTVSVSLLCYP